MSVLSNYKKHMQEIGKLQSCLSLLHWDQRTYLPKKGSDVRAEVIGKLSKMVFQLSVCDELGRYLEELEKKDGLTEQEKASVRVTAKAYRRHKAVPVDVYESFAIAQSRSETAWESAKANSDFSAFLPHLEKMVDYARRLADYYGYEENPYDALIEEYEPGMTFRKLQAIVEPLQAKLIGLVRVLCEEGSAPDPSCAEGRFDVERQRELSMRLLRTIGYDFDAGRLDTTVHPFTIMTGPVDIRVTTRFSETDLFSGFFSTLHEGGHALYDQGLAKDLMWSGLDEGASYGIHESQSRLWENMVGRSLPFWRFFLPTLSELFPEFKAVSAEDIFRAINIVRPSSIRVEADEVTYNLHIMVRLKLENALINGQVKPADLPQLWREAMSNTLGVKPESDADGVLQDVHWSSGLFGYFPSYMLGNLYGAQLFDRANDEIPDLDDRMEEGDFSSLLGWLRDRIHKHGKTYDPESLVRRVTGDDLNPTHFMEYINRKFESIYRLR